MFLYPKFAGYVFYLKKSPQWSLHILFDPQDIYYQISFFISDIWFSLHHEEFFIAETMNLASSGEYREM